MESIRVPGVVTDGPPFSPRLTARVIETIRGLVGTRPDHERPDLRIGRDLTFAVDLGDGKERLFELVGDGVFLRDPATGGLWRFSPGRPMLEEISPAQGLTEGPDEPRPG